MTLKPVIRHAAAFDIVEGRAGFFNRETSRVTRLVLLQPQAVQQIRALELRNRVLDQHDDTAGYWRLSPPTAP